jgi:hypothetical protein
MAYRAFTHIALILTPLRQAEEDIHQIDLLLCFDHASFIASSQEDSQ